MISILKQTAIGVDIADNSIEIVELSKQGEDIRVVKSSRVKLAAGIVGKGRILQAEKLSRALASAFEKAKPEAIQGKKIAVSLPESQVYTDVAALGIHDKKQRDELVRASVERSIPLASVDIAYSYQVIHEDAKSAQIFVAAANKEVVKEWSQFFKDNGYEIEGFDVETLAAYRGIYGKKPEYPVCVLDLGASTSTIAIFDAMGLRYSYAAPKAGNAFTQAIAQRFGISIEEAEKQKQTAGIADPADRTSAVILGELELVFQELHSALEYVKKEYRIEVKEIALAGGSAKLKGLAKHIQEVINLPVQLGKSALRTQKTPLVYLGAIGLGVRALDNAWEQDPMIALREEPRLKKKTATEAAAVQEETQTSDQGSAKESEELNPFPSFSKPSAADALKRRALILLSVLIGGIVLLGLSFWYRSEEENSFQWTSGLEAEYGNIQIFDFQIPVAVVPGEYKDNLVRGRVLETIVPAMVNREEFISSMGTELQSKIAKDEMLWSSPLNGDESGAGDTEQTLKWLAYRQDDLIRLLVENVEDLNAQGIKFMLTDAAVESIAPTSKSDVYILNASLSIALNELIAFPSLTPLPSPSPESMPRVLITSTPTGWLNARSSPGTEYKQVGRVYPGEKFVLLEESNGWYKIQISENLIGWVVARHAEKEKGIE